MCGGGGDGGADQMRRDEQEREARMAQATAQINAMFGVNPGAPVLTDEQKRSAQQRADLERQLQTRVRPDGTVEYPYLQMRTPRQIGEEGYYDDSDYYAEMTPQQRQSAFMRRAAQIKDQLARLPGVPNFSSLAADAERNKIARDAMYERTGDDIMGYFTDQLGQQRDRAAAAIAIDMARKGQTYGSARTDADRLLQETNDDRVMQLQTQADAAVTDLRSSDEKARLDLIARIRAGMDQQSAIAGANSALSTNIDRVREGATSQSMEGLFANIEDLYGQKRAVDAYNRGYQNTVGVTTPGSGTVETGRVY